MEQHNIIVTPSKMFHGCPKWLLLQEHLKTEVIKIHDPRGELNKLKDEFEKNGYSFEELDGIQ